MKCLKVTYLKILLYPPEAIEVIPLQWRHNEHAGISNHQPHNCLLNPLFRCRSKETSDLRITGPWAGNSVATSEFPAQRASKAENVSIWWCHHDPEHVNSNDLSRYGMVRHQYMPRIMNMSKALLCCRLVCYYPILPMSFRVTSLALWQPYDCAK